MIIEDPSLLPYFIKVEKSNYELYKKMTPKKKPDGTTPAPYDRYDSCYSSILSAVDAVIGLKMAEDKKAVSLIEFINETRRLKLLFLSITHDDIDKKFLELDKRISFLEGIERHKQAKTFN